MIFNVDEVHIDNTHIAAIGKVYCNAADYYFTIYTHINKLSGLMIIHGDKEKVETKRELLLKAWIDNQEVKTI